MNTRKSGLLILVLIFVAMMIILAISSCGGGGTGSPNGPFSGGQLPDVGGGGEQPPSGPPQITSLSPNSGQIGSNVQISGNRFSATQGSVSFNGTAATNISSWNNNTIVAKVPTGATTGNITVTNTQGTSNGINFTVTAPAGDPPRIDSLNPTSGNVGSQVVITGQYFTGITSVSFNSTTAAVFSIDSPTQITATVPTGASTGPVVATHPANGASNGVTFTVTNPPTITGLNPTSGTVGSQVVITGTNFNGTIVTFNGTASSFVVDSPTQITATVPNGATSGNVVVTTTTGSSNGVNFVVQLSWGFGWRRTGLNSPLNMCIDINNILNTACGISGIVRFNTSGIQQTTIDITPYGSMGVTVDNNGDYYIADGNTKILKYNSSWVQQTTWNYLNARDVAAEFQNNRVVILASPNGNDLRITITDANGAQVSAWTKSNYVNPTSVALDSSGNIYVVWSSSHCTIKYDQAGNVLATLGTPGTSSATDGQFNLPGAVHVASNGNIYVTDQSNYRFQAFNSSGTFIGKFTGSQGDGDSQFRSMDGIVTDDSGNVYVTDALGNKIQRFNRN